MVMLIGEFDVLSPSLCAKMPPDPAPVACTVPLTATLMLPPWPEPPAVPMYAPLALVMRPPPPPMDCRNIAGALSPEVLTVAS